MAITKLIRFNAWLGLAFAIALTILETLHNWGDWSDPAFWIIDYFACALLFGGAYLILRQTHPGGPALLAAGWGFACGMFWMAYFLIKAEAGVDPAAVEPIVLQFALGLFVWTILGLALSLISLVKKAT